MWDGRPTLPIVLGWVLTCHLPGKLGARPRERCFLLDLQTYCYSSNRSAVVWSPRCVLGTGGRMLPATQGSRWSQNQHMQNYRPSWVFPGSPVVRILSSQCQVPRFTPGQGTKISLATQTKEKKIKLQSEARALENPGWGRYSSVPGTCCGR